jgi:Metallo-peptidase family M12/FG-GAP-like repeat
MKKNLALCLVVLGLSSSSALVEAQSSISVFSRSAAPPALATAMRGPARIAPVAVDRAAMRRFREAGGGTLSLPLPDGSSLPLTLTQFDVFPKGAVITATGPLGPSPIPMDISFFKGTVAGEPDSWAVLSMTGDQILGTVNRKAGQWSIAPAAAIGGDHLVEDDAAMPARAHEFTCGADDLPTVEQGVRQMQSVRPSAAEATTTRLLCNIAVDCDHEYYANKFGSNLANATNYIATVMATISVIYEREVNTTIQVPYLNIWTALADPYTTNTTGNRLPEFQTWWNANRTGVARTLALNVSGMPLGGGIAYIDVLGNLGAGYAVIAVDGVYTYPNNATTWDIEATAHEIGHNFGSYHTQNCYWQTYGYVPAHALLDSCTAPEGSCYTGGFGTIPTNKGTIMSYCHLLAPINNAIRMDFHPACITRNRAEAQLYLSPLGVQPPLALNVTTNATGASLAWTASSASGVLHYDVYRSPFQLDLNPAFYTSTASLTAHDADPGTFYYKVRAVRAADTTAFSNEVKAAVCIPSAPVGRQVGDSPYALATGDFNEDGITDLAVANFGGDNVSILLGNGAGGVGDGTFAAPVNVTVPAGTQPSSIAVGDFNEDGISDLALAGWSAATVQILTGQGAAGVGNGSFVPGPTYFTDNFPLSVVTADLNEDGVLDLVVENQSGSTSVLIGHGTAGVGDGTFADQVSYSSGASARSLVLDDFNEDGITDLAVSVSTGASVRLGQGAAGVGDGTFGPSVLYPAGNIATGIIAGDFNDDGITDLATANATSSNISIFLGNGAAGVGNGTFGAGVTYPAGASPTGIARGDWNQDGIEDLVVCNNSANTISILTGKGSAGVGTGQFNAPQPFAAGNAPRYVVTGDFNENGIADILVVNLDSPGRVQVLNASCLGALSNAVTVTAPNGGEFWAGGTEHTITWTKGPGVIGVNVDLSRDDGANWEALASHLTGTSFTWSTTDPPSALARIRVSEDDVANHQDQSDATFNIVPLGQVAVGDSRTPLHLDGAFPNPTRGDLTVSFSLPSAAPARLELLDLAGRRVRGMDVGSLGAGAHRIALARGATLHAGVYFIRLTQGGASTAIKAVFMR